MADQASALGVQVVRGNPDEAELAAVICVLLARLNGRPEPAGLAPAGARAAWDHAPHLPHCAPTWRTTPTTPS